MSRNMISFLRGLIRLFEKLLANDRIDEQELMEEFRLTTSGDVFRGNDEGPIPNGYGVLLTNKNHLIEGFFK